MIKRRITILFLLVFSMGFTAQYKTVKGKNVKMLYKKFSTWSNPGFTF